VIPVTIRTAAAMALPVVLVGAASALPLVLGAWLALNWRLSDRVVGLIAAFGAGALISAIAFELVLDAVDHGAPAYLAAALALGAMVYFIGSELLERRSRSGDESSRGLALLMGATLDGIPESLILGISMAAGRGLSLPFLVAVIISNLPEGMASAAELRDDPDYTTKRILVMWGVVVCISAITAGLGAAVAARGAAAGAVAEAFAAGALLTMLTDDLIPEARQRGGLGAGLTAVLGFAVAFALHQLGA
jgi:ZIP family zinc transporter